jgi:anti-sigma B factor antagonist
MDRPHRHIDVERQGDVFCVSVRKRRLEEKEIHEMASEVLDLIDADGCRKLAFSLGPGLLDCLYSVFLAKLVTMQRRLREHKGEMKLCDVTPEVYDVFQACQLHQHFEFTPDRATAVGGFNK